MTPGFDGEARCDRPIRPAPTPRSQRPSTPRSIRARTISSVTRDSLALSPRAPSGPPASSSPGGRRQRPFSWLVSDWRLTATWSATPGPRPGGRQLGPGQGHHQDRPGRPPREVVEEVEQPLIGPVEVLQDQDEGTPGRHALQEPPPCVEQLLPAEPAVDVGAHQRVDVRSDGRVAERSSVARGPCWALGRGSSSRTADCDLMASPAPIGQLP